MLRSPVGRPRRRAARPRATAHRAQRSCGHLDDHLDLDREAERESLAADRRAGMVASLAEELREQIRCAVDHRGAVPELLRTGDEAEQLDDPPDPVEGSERVAGLGEQVEHAVTGSVTTCRHIEVGADAADPPVRTLTGEEEQISAADVADVMTRAGSQTGEREPELGEPGLGLKNAHAT